MGESVVYPSLVVLHVYLDSSHAHYGCACSPYPEQDPHESENGWTNSGYYTTGSTKTWMSLQIGQQIIEDTKTEVTSTSTSTMTSTVASSSSSMDVLSIGCTFILTMCAAWRIV